jgi:hypothetical protein
MSDFDLDELLAGAVDEYREHTLGQIKPAGTAIAQATATHRRHVHAVALSVLAAALVVVPISAFAVMDHPHNGPPNAPAFQNVSPSATTTPSDTPSSPTVSSPTTSSSTTAVVKPITEHDLANATLQFPTTGSWGKPCPQGKVTLVNGHYSGLSGVSDGPKDTSSGLIKVVQVDLDHDGASDAAAIFGCHLGDPPAQTAIGFRRAANGSIETMGTIENVSNSITGLTALSDGSVRLIVTNQTGSNGMAVAAQTPQARTYHWNGTRFTQTAGSTSFTVSKPGLSVQLSDVTFEKPTNGKRAGTMTVTLRNSGSKSISNATIVYVFGPFTKTSPTCAALPYGPGDFAGQCQVPSIAAGATVTVTFHFTGTDSDLTYFQTHPSLAAVDDNLVQINVGDQRLAKQPTLGNVVLK